MENGVKMDFMMLFIAVNFTIKKVSGIVFYGNPNERQHAKNV